MLRLAELKLPLSAADQPEPHLRRAVAEVLRLGIGELDAVRIFKRSFDARKAEVLAVYIVDVTLRDPRQEEAVLARLARHPHVCATPPMHWQAPARALEGLDERPVVVGFGPCGIFAALCLAQMGFRPIVIERGREVRQRTQDTWDLWRRRTLHAESNVQFGEGGAGTFSDGKLYSQIKDPRHLGRKVMEEFVAAGAPEEILWQAHPHIGTFKLVKVVENLRARIIQLGGEIRFGQRVVDLHIEAGALRGLEVLDQDRGETRTLACRHAVLALGHSARDTFVRLWETWGRDERQALLDRLPHRAPARHDRPRALGAPRRHGAARRRRLQAGPPCFQRPVGLQLLHVSGRHRGGGHLGDRPGGHQRHEPVFAQRAQCQRRHRGRH